MLALLLPAALLLGQFSGLTNAAPLVKRTSSMAQWTVRGFHWNCSDDKSVCIYAFSVAEDAAPGVPSKTPAFCHFAVHAQEKQTAFKAAFSDVPCENLSNYRCAGTWGDNGYMVLSIDNIEENRRAYFNFNITDLEDSEMLPTQQSLAYMVTAPTIPAEVASISDMDTELTAAIYPAGGDYGGGYDDADDLSSVDDADVPAVIDGLQTLDVIDDLSAQDNADDFDYSEPSDLNDYAENGDEMIQMLAEYDPAQDTSAPDNYDDYYDNDSDDAAIITTVEGQSLGGDDYSDDDEQTVPTVNQVAYPGDYSGDSDAADDSDDYILEEAIASPENLNEPVIPNDGSLGNADDDYASSAEDLAYRPQNYTTNDADYDYSAPSDDIPTVLAVPLDPVLWSMRNISRNVVYGPNAVLMHFMIDVLPDGPKAVSCALRVNVDENIEPMFASWFVEQCEDSGWYLSWGYNQLTDSAVVTLINPERTEEAWFGWNSVNSNLPDTALASVGPGIVQTCAC